MWISYTYNYEQMHFKNIYFVRNLIVKGALVIKRQKLVVHDSGKSIVKFVGFLSFTRDTLK